MGWGERHEPLLPATAPVRWPVTQAARQLADAVRAWREWPSMNRHWAMLEALDRFDAVAGEVGTDG